MERKFSSSPTRAWWLAVAVAGAVAVAVVPASAQGQRDDCRCVDGEGNAIERCTCLRAPRMDGMLGALGFDSERVRLGVTVDMEDTAGSDAAGARVRDVVEGGPADEAGIQEGDVIVAIDGQSLTASLDADAERSFDLDRSIPVQRLLALTADLETDREIEVEYIRDGRRQATRLTPRALAAWGDESLAFRFRELAENARLRSGWDGDRLPVMPRRGPTRGYAPAAPWFMGGAGGLEIVEVNRELGAYFGADEGILVTDVDRTSNFGLRPGDVVVRVGDRPVSTPDRFRRIVASYEPDEDIDFHILRDGEETTVTGRQRY